MLRKTMVSRWSVAAVLIGSLILAGAAFAQGGTTVRVDPATATAAVNDTVPVAIKVDNVTNLTAFELHLSFDPNVLEVTQLANGGFVAADFVAQNTFDNTAGTIDYAVAQLGKPAVNGSGTLLSITFRAKAAGTSPVNYRGITAAPTGVILADPNGAAIATNLANGSVTVSGSQVTPAPTTAPTETPPGTPPPTAVAPTPTPPAPAATPTPGPYPVLGTHVVRYGESLYCIGRAYMVSPWAIAQVNSIPWPYTIYPNQQMNIPNAPWLNPPYGPVCQRQFPPTGPTVTPVATVTPAPTMTPSPGGCRATYTVMPGDTLYRIALRFNSNIYAIAQANHILNINLIYAGQILCIP